MSTFSKPVFQEQSYSSLHSGRYRDINDPCGVIADFCRVIADPCSIVAIPEAISGCAVGDADCCTTH